MKITTEELINIFSSTDLNVMMGSKPIFVTLDKSTEKTNENWQVAFKEFFANTTDKNQLYIMNLSINFPYCGVNNILLAIRPKEVTPEFIGQINAYVMLDSDTSILDFLDRQWKFSPSSYPLTFFWRKNWFEESTTISYRAIAPAYRNKGLMTKISLGLIKKITESSEAKGEHRLHSIAINYHTYSFFYPKDEKNKPSYNKENNIKISCAEVLKKHNIKFESGNEDKSQIEQASNDKPSFFI